MKRTACCTVLALYALSGCGPVVEDNANTDDDQNQNDNSTFEPITESATVTNLEDMMPIEESSGSIVRYEDRIEMSVDAAGFTPGEVLTIWVSLINSPEACASDPCEGSDFGNEDVGFSALKPVGAVADDSGVAAFVKTFAAGDTADAEFGPGLTEPLTAEFLLIIRTHGQQIEDQLEEQLTTLDGGCPPNECADIQLIEFANGQ